MVAPGSLSKRSRATFFIFVVSFKQSLDFFLGKTGQSLLGRDTFQPFLNGYRSEVTFAERGLGDSSPLFLCDFQHLPDTSFYIVPKIVCHQDELSNAQIEVHFILPQCVKRLFDFSLNSAQDQGLYAKEPFAEMWEESSVDSWKLTDSTRIACGKCLGRLE